MNILTNLNLNKNELQNAVVQNVAVEPQTNNKPGQIIFSGAALKYWNGTKWVDPCTDGERVITETVSVQYGGTGKETLPKDEVIIGDGTNPVKSLPIDTKVTEDSVNLITSGAVHDAIEEALGTVEAMTFKGTITSDGTITSSDTTINGKKFTQITNYKRGWTFKASANISKTVINIDNKDIEAGDMIIAIGDCAGAYTSSDMSVIQGNIDGTVIGPSSVSSGTLCVFDGATGKLIKASTITEKELSDWMDAMFNLSNTTDADIELSSNNATPTVVGKGNTVSASLKPSGVTAGTYGENTDTEITGGDKIIVPAFTVDEKGRVTSAENQELTINITGTVKKYEVLCPSMSPANGTCTWNIKHDLECYPVVTIYTRDGDVVISDIKRVDDNNIRIFINSSTAINAGDYRCVAIG